MRVTISMPNLKKNPKNKNRKPTNQPKSKLQQGAARLGHEAWSWLPIEGSGNSWPAHVQEGDTPCNSINFTNWS